MNCKMHNIVGSAGRHDRCEKDIGRAFGAHIVEAVVDDPFELGARIATVRSVRDEPLADCLARGHIDRCQFEAGKGISKVLPEIAERGLRSIQWTERGGRRFATGKPLRTLS